MNSYFKARRADKLTKKDIVGNLPTELVQKILGYLTGEDLAKCSMVCKNWRSLANSDFLWKRLCKQDHPDELQVPPPVQPGKYSEKNPLWEPTCGCKLSYSRAEITLKKWSHNDYWTFMIDDPLAVAYLGNGAILVVIIADGHIDVYDLNSRRVPKLIQRVPPFLTTSFKNRRMVKLHSSKDTLVIQTRYPTYDAKIFLCYKWLGTELKFMEAIYCLKTEERGNELHTTTGPLPTSGINTGVTLLAVLGETLAIYDMEETAIYFWSFQESRCTGRVLKIKGCREYAFRKHLYMCTTNFIVAYDTNGNEWFRKEIPPLVCYVDDIVLHFNRKVLLAELPSTGEYRVVLAWDWNLKTLGNQTGFTLIHEVALHPKLPLVCYVHQNEELFQYDELGYEIITRDLVTDTILSRIPFSLKYGTDSSFSGGGHLSFVHYKYLLYLPGYNTDFYKEQILLHWQTGKVIFHEKSKNFHIQYVGSKLIEGNKYYKRKKLFNLRIYT